MIYISLHSVFSGDSNKIPSQITFLMTVKLRSGDTLNAAWETNGECNVALTRI